MLPRRLRRWKRKIAGGIVLYKKAAEKIRPPKTESSSAYEFKINKSDLSGAVIIITGSSSGIGRALAEAFLAAGAFVVINGRNKPALEAAYKKLNAKYDNVLAVAADISKEGDAQILINESVKRFGKIDVLINNAGILGLIDKKIWEMDLKEWRSVMGTNLDGAFLCSSEIIRWAINNRHPIRIINVSSGVVDYGAPHLGAYMVSKAGMEALTVAVDADCSDDNPYVSIVSIKPRSVSTKMTENYYTALENALFEDPDALAPIFLYAASAPTHEVMGKSLSEPSFSIDPQGEIILNNSLASVKVWRPEPDNRQQGDPAGSVDESGAYMHLLQNPVGIYPSVADIFNKNIEAKELSNYPDPKYTDLRTAISRHTGLDPAYLAFGPGSSELLDRAIRTFSRPRSEIIITKPTWGGIIWPSIRRNHIRPVEVSILGSMEKKDIRHDLQGILRKITPKTSLIYLVNPCNPTGTIVDKNELVEFLHRVPSHVTVILDEAYYDYCEKEKRFILKDVMDSIPCRALGLRTFSKYFALAGFRIGYAYGTREVIDYIDRSEIPFSVSNIAQAAAVMALADTEAQYKTYTDNLAQRQYLCRELDRLNIPNMPSQTNFVLFNCPLDRNKMRSALKKEGIFMPNVDALFYNNYAITTVGWPEHNQKIIELLSKY